jgi:hypothetical protein
MKSQIAAFAICLLTSSICAQAAPPPGRYSGILRLTKHVDGLNVTASVRAVATVSAKGGLTIVLATAQSPLPDIDAPGTTPADVLRTTITAENSCVIPGKPKPFAQPSAPLSEPALSPKVLDPVFSGTVRTNGKTFSLTYTDIPTNYEYVIRPLNFTEFTYTFRQVSP